MQLPRPTAGSVTFEGDELTTMSTKDMREARTRMQMIFQDPISSLNPRRKVRDIVMEPLTIWKRGVRAERAELVDRTLEEVGIDPTRAAESQAHQFSGGQCQRISIARSLVLDPSLIICDEPVSALDVSVQAQVLNLLEDLKAQARPDADLHRPRPRRRQEHQRPRRRDVPRQAVRGRPQRRSVPGADAPVHERAAGVDPGARSGGRPSQVAVVGEPPSPVLPPPGCRFHPRCPNATDVCTTTEPELRELAAGHFVACHNPVMESPVAVHVTPTADADRRAPPDARDRGRYGRGMIPTAAFGRTGHHSTRLIFGAAALGGMSQERADATLAEVHAWGINHIDTAASYGASEDRLQPWLADHRHEVFLATKTGERHGDAARAELERSLQRMAVDHVDLVQLHNLVEPDEWDVAHGPGGAVEALARARDEGLVRHIGVTGHGLRIAEMHLRSLDRFPFDSRAVPLQPLAAGRAGRIAPMSRRSSSDATPTALRCRRSSRSPVAGGPTMQQVRASPGTSR